MGGRTAGSCSHAYRTLKKHVYGGVVPQFAACIHMDGHSPHPCGAPTTNYAQRCDKCETKRRTGLDRTPPDEPNEPHPWRKPMKL